MAQYAPERILIEPSGVGKLSDVIKAVENAKLDNAALNAFCTVVDASKCKMYMKNFGEFFNDQVENAGCIILSHTDKTSAEKLAVAVDLLKGKNATATMVTAAWDSLDGKAILAAMEQKDCLKADLDRLASEVHHHHHEEECHDPNCGCHHHHDEDHHHHHHEEECHDPNCGCHHHHDEEHHHHHHEEECHDPDCGCHHHDHDHEHGHGCHEHHHEHHHGHHHADEVFTSWGIETTRVFTKEELENALAEIQHEHEYGIVLRAKGIVAGEGCWLHFDYVPGEADVREGCAGVTGRLCDTAAS